MWWVLAFCALAAGGTLGSVYRRNKRLNTWRKAIRSCGFTEVKRPDPEATPAFEAQAGSLTLRIEDLGSRRIAVVVPGPPSLSGVRISHEGARPLETRMVRTGDELFDNQIFVEGPVQVLTGLLDAETRRLLLGGSIEDWLEITRKEIRMETSDENLQNLLPLVADIRRRFVRSGDIAQHLSDNARHDPEAGVRLRNLLLLIREHPEKSPTREALHKACSDPAPEIRLRAAMALEGDHSDILVELAESLVDDKVSAEAVSALDRALPFERTRAILDQALDRSLVWTARACLEALGRSGDPAAVDVLAEVMAREGGKTAAAAALALGATGRPAAEPPLLLALQREDTRVAAADALARTGTTEAVLPLEEAAERAPEDKDLRRATRQAVAEIQSRLPGASPGQLSLAQDEAGQLSLTEAEAGQLSLAHAESPLLPHSADEAEQPSRNARETPGVRQG